MRKRGLPARLLQNLQATAGIIRSLRIYYGDRTRLHRMTALYAIFIRPGDLVFDIGAHVGDRIAAFLRLGANVVAVEPQPAAFRCLRLIYARRRGVVLIRAAVAEREGRLTFRINTSNPTVSTASSDFLAAADGAPGWQGQYWDRQIDVNATTLDKLIEQHGRPAFIKIDIEGFEDKALTGLTHAVPALSFEFTTIQREVAQRCLEQLIRLGDYAFNAALGESQRFEFDEWQKAGKLGDWLSALPAEANSGDIYAVLSKAQQDRR